MKIFNWVHRKINGQQIHDEAKQEDCGSVSFKYWQNGLLCIGTLGGDDQKRVHPEQEEKEEEHEHGYELQHKDEHEHEDESHETVPVLPVAVLEAEDEADITAAEVEMFKKNLAKILGIGDELSDTNNHHSPRPKENFGLRDDPDSAKAHNQKFPLEEFLEIPVSPITINGASEKKKKKKKKQKSNLAKNALGTLLFSKKQQATDEKSNGANAVHDDKVLPAPSAKKADFSVVDKILHWTKKRSVSASSAPPEALPHSKISKFKSMLKEKGGRALKKGGGKDEVTRSGPLVRENNDKAPFSSSCRSDTYLSRVQEREGIAGHEEDFISLSRDHSLGRIQEYWIKTNSEFVVLEL
ncbi:hypothetical protein SUGI_0508830 [Cryptomeria japonica]|uniref:uncharacterized protein LOC131076460 n=1 Tax=Cryptomeria japonica TaxID=3369 RepID=UPI002408D351|nr:uncharacterized protein LOC131076460 [Cryptomeria japonica]GLJ26391.1 hypothetical protein SUGI_0508830 [Cryptomeria japonica]